MAKTQNKNPVGRPRIFKDAEDLERRLNDYKEYLRDNDKPPTIAGLAYYTGIDRQTIYNYSERDEYFDILKRFRDWIMMNYEELAIEKGNGGIVFLLKNYGYTDKQEIQHDGNLDTTIRFIPASKMKKDDK